MPTTDLYTKWKTKLKNALWLRKCIFRWTELWYSFIRNIQLRAYYLSNVNKPEAPQSPQISICARDLIRDISNFWLGFLFCFSLNCTNATKCHFDFIYRIYHFIGINIFTFNWQFEFNGNQICCVFYFFQSIRLHFYHKTNVNVQCLHKIWENFIRLQCAWTVRNTMRKMVLFLKSLNSIMRVFTICTNTCTIMMAVYCLCIIQFVVQIDSFKLLAFESKALTM